MADAATAGAVPVESDFSLRKMKISFAVLLGTLFGSSVLPFMAISLLMLPMTQEFGWSRTAFSVGQTAMMLAGAAVSPLLGWLVDRVGAKAMIVGGTVIVGLVVMAMSLQDGSLWQFYLSFAVLGITGTTAIGYSKIIGSLFNQHRGKALAIFGIESSIAGALAPPIIAWLIASHGWRGMFVGLGIIILSTVPVLLLWLKEPDAPGVSAQTGAHVAPDSLPGLTTREVLRTRAFWFIALASFLAIGPAFGMMPHWVAFLDERGFGMETMAPMLSAMTLAMAAGTVVGGWAVDWAKGAWIAAPFSLLTTLALAVFLFVSSQVGGIWMLTLAMATLGFAGGAKRPMGTYFQLRFFGLKSFGTITGIQSPFLAAGMGLFPPLIGRCYDVYGTYQPVFWGMVVAMGVTVLLYLVLGPYRFEKNLMDAPAADEAQVEAVEQHPVTAAAVTA